MIYFDNAYRALGLYDNATRSEVRNVFHQLKIRSKVAAGAGPADPLSLLAPTDRSEDALRDAFNALGNVSERLRHRLFWFSKSTSRDTYALDCIASGDFTGAVEAWGSTSEPSSRANLARLYHLLMIARDLLPSMEEGKERPAIPEKYSWTDAMRVWREVIESDTFWEEFAAVERASGFEPPAFDSDIAALRSRVWESLLQPSLTLVARMVERKEYQKARDHIEDLRDADISAPRVAELEKESFVPVVSSVDALVDEITTELDTGALTYGSVRAAYVRYRKEVLPQLREMLKHAGYNFEPTRQLCETCSELLLHLARTAANVNEVPFAISLQNEAAEILKGGIEGEAQRAGSAMQSDAGSAATERSSQRTIPGWVVLKIMLIVIAVGIRMASCGGSSTSSYSSSRLLEDRMGSIPKVELPELDTSALAYLDTFSLEPSASSEKVAALYTRYRELGEARTVLRPLMHELDNSHARIAELDSQVIAAGRSDSVNSGIASRAAQVWLRKYRKDWSRFDTLYQSFASDLATYNRDVAKIPESDDPPSKMELDDDLRAAHKSNKRRMAIWTRKYGEVE